MKLGKMTKVPLRDVWPHEERDFSRWLSETENLEMLGEVIGADLEPIERESKIGKYSLDILAKDAATNQTVIIENQLEDSNHDHLGKLITYAAGKNADVVVWIVKKANDEHRQAIEWLNNRTDRNLGFFLLEIEMWKIGDSDPAPRFNVVESPNEWTKVERDETVSDTGKTCQKFWSAFNDYAQKNKDFMALFNIRKPRPQNWYDFAIGKSNCHLVIGASVYYKELKVGLYVHGDQELSELFLDNVSALEEEYGIKLSIGQAQDKSFYFKKKFDFENDETIWPSCFEWYCEMLPKLRASVYRIIEERK